MKKLLLILPLLFLTSCTAERKSLLGWCLWEIRKHEDYECDCAYTYSEVYNYDFSSEPNIECWVIDCYLDDRIGRWFCYIEYSTYSFDGLYSANEIINIDCDILFEQKYNGEIL